jgi:hypothetical protein
LLFAAAANVPDDAAHAFSSLSPAAAAAAADTQPPPHSPAALAKASAWGRAARLAIEAPDAASPTWHLQQHRLAADALASPRLESQQLQAALKGLALASQSLEHRVHHIAACAPFGRGSTAGGVAPSPFESHAHWLAQVGSQGDPFQSHSSTAARSLRWLASSGGRSSSSSSGDGGGNRPVLFARGSAASRFGPDNFADLDAYLDAAFAGNPPATHLVAPLAPPFGGTAPLGSSPYGRHPGAERGPYAYARPYALRGGVGDRLREIYATF